MTLSLPSAPAKSVKPAEPCIVTRTREDLATEDQTKLDGWLADLDVAAWRVADAIGVGPTTIKDHRGQRCGCYRGKTS